MRIEVEKRKNINVLHLSGKMTIGQGDVTLREKFRELLETGERCFIFNMAGVPYMDSAAVGETVACYKRAAEQAAVIKIVVPPRSKVYEVFVLTSLDRVFELFADEDQALASFPG